MQRTSVHTAYAEVSVPVAVSVIWNVQLRKLSFAAQSAESMAAAEAQLDLLVQRICAAVLADGEAK